MLSKDSISVGELVGGHLKRISGFLRQSQELLKLEFFPNKPKESINLNLGEPFEVQSVFDGALE